MALLLKSRLALSPSRSVSPVLARTQVRTPWGWAGAGGVLGVLLCLLMFAPARWLSAGLQQVSSGQLQVVEVRGTLWDGSGRVIFTGGAGSLDSATLPGRLQWQLQPAFTQGAPGLIVQLRADCCLKQAWLWHIAPGWGGVQVTLSDNTSQWPAQGLSGLGTPWNTLDFDGQLALSTQALSLTLTAGQIQVAGKAQLDALALSSRLSTLRPMGNYRLMLSGGGIPELQLTTLSGALQLSGRGQWVGKRLRFEGEATAAPESQAALSNLLNIIGRRNGARSIIKVG